MKNVRAICVLGLLSLASATLAQAQQTGTTEKAVAALENQWLQSQKTNNADLVAPLFADKFVNTGIDGKVTNKDQTLAEAKATKWTSAEYKDVQVTAYGNAAVATGEFKGKGTDGSGKALDEDVRWTDTWVKMPDGKWQCVASQDSPIKK
jgi:uncharacterized protein (TIGR02246 family)